MTKTKISIVPCDLSGGGSLMAILLVQALEQDYDVEVVGAAFGQGLWPPLEPLRRHIRSWEGHRFPSFARTARAIVAALDGDVIIALKPRFPSLGLALIKRRLSGKKVILIVDDDELAMTEPGRHRGIVNKLREPSGYWWTRLAHRCAGRADAVLCTSRYFQKRYGGALIPMSRSKTDYDPARFDRAQYRELMQVSDTDFVVPFIGVPAEHKGLDQMLEAIRRIGDPRVKFVLIPPGEGNGYARRLAAEYPETVKLLINQPSSSVPGYIYASDVVILSQRNEPNTYGQMPAKLAESMAMARPVIASDMADIAAVLGDGGFAIEPENVDQLTERLRWVMDNPEDAARMGEAGRKRFLADLTLSSLRDALLPFIQQLSAK